ncbi:MAG: hypothetical protein A2497_00380 [Candidatus Firestonebacteria bacterium RifOxyC12_full_39_7]|nr:MAG: hypothetical protein A2497_00380 [Candidatus Firestonebacteria bacterium RifOxyC12_full_39_7]
MVEEISFSMIENAEDSLAHAIFHLTGEKSPTKKDFKRAILDTSHAVELLLKERLKVIHPAFVLEDIDKYPSKEASTVNVDLAIKRIKNICNLSIPEDMIKIVKRCRKIRNEIEHYEVNITKKEAEAVIGNMLSFIFDFAEKYLGLNLEKKFKKDEDMWEKLIVIHEFCEKHVRICEGKLFDKKILVDYCPYCGRQTFNVDSEKCEFCGHEEEMFECASCGGKYFMEEKSEKNEEGDPLCSECASKHGD